MGSSRLSVQGHLIVFTIHSSLDKMNGYIEIKGHLEAFRHFYLRLLSYCDFIAGIIDSGVDFEITSWHLKGVVSLYYLS